MPDIPWRSGAGYDHREGLSVGIGSSTKTFSQTETTDSKTYTEEITVAPGTTAYLYQKVYRFKTWMWFINDA
ncbi:hypothetical protein AtubIFM55763_003622 [Aspergillus tubingensis]|uniref:Uncharacterized protein n=1 Tax=Aspergillus tubingensis TaxID=5068 RepID=A0A9W6EJB3_ASPTU|nr:hypothetical protein AtubIFM54640_002855 [Aspergillus tubingensis]GLA72734.1 hypothetical protein AtubIFM55763_003622 [Aspergillus tubingensis]GLA81524.1 hypothetical protein AtubIFM56815_005181 [Aspergillus tubingensis]GLB17362.1 hypothetical protein AtubIFM61612_007227 [Aspergillus tubingensis]